MSTQTLTLTYLIGSTLDSNSALSSRIERWKRNFWKF